MPGRSGGSGRRSSPGGGAALGLLLVTSLAGGGCTRADHAVARLLASQRLAAPPAGAVAYLERMAHATGLYRALVVNAVPARADELAVFFLHRDLDWERLRRQGEELLALEDNCCALGDEATISCDAQFLDGFLSKHSEYPVTEQRQRALLRWVLGHELGHLAHHQGGLHFAPVERRRQSLRNLAVQRQEYAADCWMYQRLTDLYGADEVVAVESLAIDFINARLLQTRGRPPVGAGILYDYTRLDLYDFRVDASHPDLLLRSARLLHVATSAGRNPGLESMVKGFMTRLVPDPLWKDGGPCS